MKLEVGMYVRTIGGIERLKKENDNGWFFEKSMIIKPDNIEKYIIKASFNIIDLIEVGDYVNGYYVEEVRDVFDGKDTYTRICLASGCNYFQPDITEKEDIKSIVTKEKFESMSYKVEE